MGDRGEVGAARAEEGEEADRVQQQMKQLAYCFWSGRVVDEKSER